MIRRPPRSTPKPSSAASDVYKRQLTYVERGNADVGIVYRTDAKLAEDLSILDIIPLEAYDQVLYVAATTKAARNIGEAMNFCEFLLGEEARAIFTDHGFSFP